jgi:hypothetical protein
MTRAQHAAPFRSGEQSQPSTCEVGEEEQASAPNRHRQKEESSRLVLTVVAGGLLGRPNGLAKLAAHLMIGGEGQTVNGRLAGSAGETDEIVERELTV